MEPLKSCGVWLLVGRYQALYPEDGISCKAWLENMLTSCFVAKSLVPRWIVAAYDRHE